MIHDHDIIILNYLSFLILCLCLTVELCFLDNSYLRVALYSELFQSFLYRKILWIRLANVSLELRLHVRIYFYIIHAKD